jgi:hypothetical protein
VEVKMARSIGYVGSAIALTLLIGCKESEKSTAGAATAIAASAVAPLQDRSPVEPAPAGCKASNTPVELGSSKGSVFGFIGDPTSLYFASWQELGSRGDLGKIRKDGNGMLALTSFQLEPRALAMDDNDLYFTEGIRLSTIPKEGGASKVIEAKFSSQSIALDATHVYGIPGDYGPYDRLVRMEKRGGVNFEMDTATRPEAKTGPVGYSAIAVDTAGIYVTDSGNHRILKFPLERAKPKVLATGQLKAFDMVAIGETLYFTLAEKGHLLAIAKTGGPVRKLATGLVPKSRIAGDDAAIVASFLGDGGDPPTEVSLVPISGGERKILTSVAHTQSVEGVSLDEKCVYYATRAAGSGKLRFYAIAR